MLGEPELDLDKVELPDEGEMTFSFEIEVAPEFELPQYEGIEVKKPILEINDDRVTEQLDQWRQRQAKFEPTDQPAAAGDVVTADVTISVADQPEQRLKDHVLRVAPGQVEGLPIVELADALAGKTSGQTATVTLKVPKAHPNESWRGKEAKVQIALTQVRRRILPEIDEAFAQQAGFENVQQLRAQVKRSLDARLAGEVRQAMRDQVSGYLLGKTQFDLPEGAAARHAARVMQRRYVDLLYQGVPREKIEENLAQLQAAAEQQAKGDLKLMFVLGKVADELGIKVSEGEVNARIAAMANQNNRRPERMEQELQQEGTLGEVEVAIREEKTLDALLVKAKVIEVTPEELRAQTEAAEKARLEERKEESGEPQPEIAQTQPEPAGEEAQNAQPTAQEPQAQVARGPAARGPEAKEDAQAQGPGRRRGRRTKGIGRNGRKTKEAQGPGRGKNRRSPGVPGGAG